MNLYLEKLTDFYQCIENNMKLTNDHKRNLHVLLVACVLNFSFAFEKLFIIMKNPLSDTVWFCIYGWIGLYLAIIAIYDYIQDIREDNNSNSNIIV